MAGLFTFVATERAFDTHLSYSRSLNGKSLSAQDMFPTTLVVISIVFRTVSCDPDLRNRPIRHGSAPDPKGRERHGLANRPRALEGHGGARDPAAHGHQRNDPLL